MAYTTIDDPSIYFDIKNYTQAGSNNDGDDVTLTMDDCSLIWIKNRSYANGHCIFDEVRGGTKLLASNSTREAETAGGAITFGDSSSTIGNDSGGYGFNNRVGDNYVAWHWKAGTTSGKSTTSETITPSGYSVNTTSKFGIYAYTGTGSAGYINHGLGATPAMIFIKERNNVSGWYVWHKNLTATTGYMMVLNTTAAVGTTSSGTAGPLANTAPTSTLYRLGTDSDANNSSDTYVNYVFADVQGFSKFGTYTGNGNADGTFVYTGMRSSFIMTKRTDSSGDWLTYDSKREGYNVDNDYLKANATSVEQADVDIDIVSNGFKIRNTAGDQNASGGTYIYMAFAEAPFVNSEGVPCNAR